MKIQALGLSFYETRWLWRRVLAGYCTLSMCRAAIRMNIRAAQRIKCSQSAWVTNVPALLVFYSVVHSFLLSPIILSPLDWYKLHVNALLYVCLCEWLMHGSGWNIGLTYMSVLITLFSVTISCVATGLWSLAKLALCARRSFKWISWWEFRTWSPICTSRVMTEFGSTDLICCRLLQRNQHNRNSDFICCRLLQNIEHYRTHWPYLFCLILKTQFCSNWLRVKDVMNLHSLHKKVVPSTWNIHSVSTYIAFHLFVIFLAISNLHCLGIAIPKLLVLWGWWPYFYLITVMVVQGCTNWSGLHAENDDATLHCIFMYVCCIW